MSDSSKKTEKLFSSRDFKLVLYNILIRKYEVTADILKKIFWPSFVLIIALFFSAEVRTLLTSVTESLSQTTVVKIGDIEFVVDRSFFDSTDLKAFGFIQELSQEELLIVFDMAGAAVALEGISLTEEEEKALISLEKQDLVKFIDSSGDDIELGKADRITSTEMGERVYKEIQNVSIYFIKKARIVGAENNK